MTLPRLRARVAAGDVSLVNEARVGAWVTAVGEWLCSRRPCVSREDREFGRREGRKLAVAVADAARHVRDTMLARGETPPDGWDVHDLLYPSTAAAPRTSAEDARGIREIDQLLVQGGLLAHVGEGAAVFALTLPRTTAARTWSPWQRVEPVRRDVKRRRL